ncbi:unnamed protein product [Mytilus coruscus]|uniref:CCHC-type domain-containing protein n=1 Tax=Mytilus coruscus TaxID=42192 RepID=A0A6J8AXW8_MYTCO|nr:unnamed protein product [Mytilus coruscus]
MAAFGLIGKIDPYDEAIEPWDSYVERLDQYFVANEIDGNKKVPALLCLIGGKLYSLLRDLTFPDKPAEKTFDVLVKLLKDHLAPKPLQASERFRFDKRDQKEGDSIQDYVAQLRNYYCIVVLTQTSKKKKDLTYDKAVDIGVAMETASKDATELQAKHRTEGVNKMSARKSKFQPQQNKRSSRCYRCNIAGHSPFDCKFKNTICHNCIKTGHIKKACMSKSKKPQPRKFDNKKSVHAIEEDSDSDNCIASLET